MANGNGNIKTTMVISSGVLIAVGTIVVNLFLGVSREAAIAIEVAKQHGEEFVAVRQELSLLRDSMRDATVDRYKGKDAERDIGYLNNRITALEKQIEKLEQHH